MSNSTRENANRPVAEAGTPHLPLGTRSEHDQRAALSEPSPQYAEQLNKFQDLFSRQ